jgi:hypothetical protein
MGWTASLFAAALAGVTSLLLAGWVANAAVSWYSISSFEGKAGCFVVFVALGGLVGGVVIGLIASRFIAASASPGFLKALGLSRAAVIGVIGGYYRLMAHVPPRLDGQTLRLRLRSTLRPLIARNPASRPSGRSTAPSRWGSSRQPHPAG